MQTQVWSNPLKSWVERNEYSAGSKHSCGSSYLSGYKLTCSALTETFPIQYYLEFSIFKHFYSISFNEMTEVILKYYLATLTFFYELFLISN